MSGFLHLLSGFSFGYWRRHPVITLLAVLSIALGAAVYLAVCVANHSAVRAFRASLDLVSGKSHLEVRARSGVLEEAAFPLARGVANVAAATPVVEGYATLPGRPGEYLHLLGLDVFSNVPFQTHEVTRSSELLRNPEAWFARPGQLLLDARLADALRLEPGDTFSIEVNTRIVDVDVAFLRQAEGLDEATSERVAALDIGWAQELLQAQGELSSIQILLEDPAQLDATVVALEKILPSHLEVAPPAQRSGQLEKMLGGFQLNLVALSLVSILVGVFLVYNAVAAGVVRRRRETGILLSLGISRAQVRTLFLVEAMVLAALGILIGIPLGLLLGKALLAHVGGIISMHYLAIHATETFLAPRHLVETCAYGFVAAIFGAWLPAAEAARCQPAQVLRPGQTATAAHASQGWGKWGRLVGAALLFALAGLTAWIALGYARPLFSFATCFLVVAGFALLVPALTRLLASPLAGKPFASFELLQLGRGNLLASLHRNGMTIAALMASVAMATGVSTMIHSFRNTIVTWTEQSMVSDLYVAPAANLVLGRETYLPEAVRTFLDQDPAVARTEGYLERKAFSDDGRPFKINVVDGIIRGNLPFLEGDSEQREAQWSQPGNVFVNEAYARRFGKKDGDEVDLETPSGTTAFTVAGVYRDYADDRGVVLLARANFDQIWNDDRIHSVAVDLKPGADLEDLRTRLRSHFAAQRGGELILFSNRDLREKVYEVFDATFAVTYVLRSIAVFVAIFGVILTLTTLVGERRRDIGVIRALGASRGQVQAIHLGEAGLVGWFSALIGIACGLVLAVVLTWVVNPAFFGWTVDFSVPWIEILAALIWVPVVAVLAGIWPSAEAGRVPPAESLRMD